MNDVDRKRPEASTLVSGLILIAFGVLFLLDRIGVADFSDIIRTYWPMMLMLIGATKLWRRETFWSGLWLIMVAMWLQVVTLKLYGLTYGNSWPLLLIVLGGGIILRTVIEAARHREERHGR